MGREDGVQDPEGLGKSGNSSEEGGIDGCSRSKKV